MIDLVLTGWLHQVADIEGFSEVWWCTLVRAYQKAQKIVNNAKNEIDNQKQAALIDLKNQTGMMALEIAEKIIKKQLSGDSEQEKFANSLIDDIKLN